MSGFPLFLFVSALLFPSFSFPLLSCRSSPLPSPLSQCRVSLGILLLLCFLVLSPVRLNGSEIFTQFVIHVRYKVFSLCFFVVVVVVVYVPGKVPVIKLHYLQSVVLSEMS